MTTETTETIARITATPATLARASKLWDAKNDAGEGFNPELDYLEEIAALEGTDEVLLVRAGERLLAVGWLHGAWAVEVTDELG